MPQVQLDGRTVEVLDVGGEGPPILLTPDGGAASADLQSRFSGFADVYRLIAWPPPTGDGDAVRDHAHQAMDLLHVLGIERAIFAGVGTGGLVSVRAALQAPDRVRGLLLFDLPRGEASELARIDELDIPTLLVQTTAAGARGLTAVRELADGVRDLRGVHLFDDDVAAVDPVRGAVVDALVRDYLESLPA